MHTAGDPELKVYGIFGYPLGHTVSPAIQNSAFDHYGLKSFYFAFERPPARFRFLMRHLRSLLLDGFNVTVPYKWVILKYLRRNLTPTARAIGAVNTVFRKGKRWFGDNTDCYGFLTSLRKEGRFSPRGKRVLLLGAGGAARAVAYGLGQSGATEVRLVNRPRFQKRREDIVRKFNKLFSPRTKFIGFSLNRQNLKRGLKDVQLVVDATSTSGDPDRRLIPIDLIPKARRGRHLLFFDLVYYKKRPFLKDAKRKGHRILDGKSMLLHQGAKAFEIWTGRRAPIQQMRKALHDALHSQ
ncbi:MAG: shikimate dehydrogenase [Candidatus Omnitrophica bacterium]|nr:shikimate dehydrogenase [Candidatus Omnitrophota bacterium]